MFTKWSMERTSQKWAVNEMFYQILGELLFVNQNNNLYSSNTSRIPCDCKP